MDLKYLKGVGDQRAEAFRKIGIESLDDFLKFIPRTYIKMVSVREVLKNLGENVLVTGEVIDIRYPKHNHQPIEITLFDKTGSVEIPIFGASEFRSKQFRLKDSFLFWIKTDNDNFSSRLKISYRDHIKLNIADPFEADFLKYKFIPLYELSGVLKKSWIRPLLLSKIVFNAFNTLLKSNPNYIEETLPEHFLKEYDLISKKDAVVRINFPLNIPILKLHEDAWLLKSFFF